MPSFCVRIARGGPEHFQTRRSTIETAEFGATRALRRSLPKTDLELLEPSRFRNIQLWCAALPFILVTTPALVLVRGPALWGGQRDDGLATDTETLDERAVPCNVLLRQVLEKTTTATDEQQQATT